MVVAATIRGHFSRSMRRLPIRLSITALGAPTITGASFATFVGGADRALPDASFKSRAGADPETARRISLIWPRWLEFAAGSPL